MKTFLLLDQGSIARVIMTEIANFSSKKYEASKIMKCSVELELNFSQAILANQKRFRAKLS